jgi:hypothetical protein
MPGGKELGLCSQAEDREPAGRILLQAGSPAGPGLRPEDSQAGDTGGLDTLSRQAAGCLLLSVDPDQVEDEVMGRCGSLVEFALDYGGALTGYRPRSSSSSTSSVCLVLAPHLYPATPGRHHPPLPLSRWPLVKPYLPVSRRERPSLTASGRSARLGRSTSSGALSTFQKVCHSLSLSICIMMSPFFGPDDPGKQGWHAVPGAQIIDSRRHREGHTWGQAISRSCGTKIK